MRWIVQYKRQRHRETSDEMQFKINQALQTCISISDFWYNHLKADGHVVIGYRIVTCEQR